VLYRLARGVSEAYDDDDPVHLRDKGHGIRHHCGGRRVDDHAVIFGLRPLEQLLHSLRVDQLGWVGRQGTGAEKVHTLYLPDRGLLAEHAGENQAEPDFFELHVQLCAQRGPAQVRLHIEHSLAGPSLGEGEVPGDRRLAVLGGRRGNEDGVDFLFDVEVLEGRLQHPERFPFLPRLLGVGAAGDDALALWDGCEDRQLETLCDFVDVL